MLKGKSILLGITGSVAAYKSIELIKQLKQEGASVAVIMTEAAQRFVTPLSIELAAGSKVYTDMFADPLAHVTLPASADLFVVAPATANIISKYAQGIADDLLSTALLAYKGACVCAPAMNWRMYENSLWQKNLESLSSLGVRFVGPERGSLACGEEGIGRMAEVGTIAEEIKCALLEHDFAGERVLVTAGPTREYIDPVRYISNRSSGKMGFALAKVARRRGAQVTLISGPVAIPSPYAITTIKVETAHGMHNAVMEQINNATVFIMSAAVADFMPSEMKERKSEKKEAMSLSLLKTPDILEEVGALATRPFTAGFSAETGARLDRARRKLAQKNLDMIVFNDVTKEGAGFDADTNQVVMIDRIEERELPLMTKEDVAVAIFDRIKELKTRIRR